MLIPIRDRQGDQIQQSVRVGDVGGLEVQACVFFVHVRKLAPRSSRARARYPQPPTWRLGTSRPTRRLVEPARLPLASDMPSLNRDLDDTVRAPLERAAWLGIESILRTAQGIPPPRHPEPGQ